MLQGCWSHGYTIASEVTGEREGGIEKSRKAEKVVEEKEEAASRQCGGKSACCWRGMARSVSTQFRATPRPRVNRHCGKGGGRERKGGLSRVRNDRGRVLPPVGRATSAR